MVLQGPEAGLHSYYFQVGELGRPLPGAGAFLHTHCARVRRLPGSPGVWPRGPPCWRVFRRQTPACLKPGSSCPRALRAEAAGPRFCPFLSHNSCPVSHLSLPTPSACALGNIRVLCVLESLALHMLKSSPITSVPLPVCTGSSGCLPSPIV